MHAIGHQVVEASCGLPTVGAFYVLMTSGFCLATRYRGFVCVSCQVLAIAGVPSLLGS